MLIWRESISLISSYHISLKYTYCNYIFLQKGKTIWAAMRILMEKNIHKKPMATSFCNLVLFTKAVSLGYFRHVSLLLLKIKSQITLQKMGNSLPLKNTCYSTFSDKSTQCRIDLQGNMTTCTLCRWQSLAFPYDSMCI